MQALFSILVNRFYQYDDYIKSKSRKVSAGMVRTYNVAKQRLLAFQKYRKQKITFESFDYNFYDALQKEVLASNYLHADEIPIKVLDKDKKGETHRGYFWVYHNSLQDTVLFDYQPGRGREGPSEILKNFQSHLQTDGYAAYNIFKEHKDVTLLHCMAHARRKFIEAEPNDTERSRYALEQIQQLYAIERKATDEQLSELDVLKLRQQESVPILESLGKWMQQAYVEVLPKSAIGKALGYSIERWKQLMIYTTDGKLNIDNNPVERAIRPVAIGRKITCSPEVMKLLSGAQCYIPRWKPANFMMLIPSTGSKKYWKSCLLILLIKFSNYCPTTGNSRACRKS
jgi:hypothetical protein